MKRWKLILHGNEKYPYPLSIHTDDGEEWIARDGEASSLEHAHLIVAAPALHEALARLLEAVSDEEDGTVRPPRASDVVAARVALALAKGTDD